VGKGFFDQYSVFCVFGSVVGCVVVPLITQVSYMIIDSFHLVMYMCSSSVIFVALYLCSLTVSVLFSIMNGVSYCT
jgi:hypothetical protein